jgi:SSS family solute:Na+ symporter
MTGLDWLVVFLYALVVVAIGVWANRRQTDTEVYFVGNRGLPWWATGVSIIATSFSAASLLGIPGYAYASNLWYLQFQAGDILAALIVCALFIPFFHRARLTTAYEYLEARFDLKTRLLGSTLFMLSAILRAGALLYGAALLFATVAPIDLVPGHLTPVEETIIIIGFVAIAYTMAGGISAVIWTDVIQFLVILAGIAGALFIVVHGTPGGWLDAWREAAAAGKWKAVHFDPASLADKRGILASVFGYGLLALSLFGTNQQPVQRYLSVKDVGAARKALLFGVGAGAISVVATLVLGVFLFLFYQHHPGRLPEGLIADKVFPHFIATEMPPLLTGLFVSAVFAAAMSSLDSALNSLATAGTTDFYTRLARRAPDEKKKLRVAKGIVLAGGVVAIYFGLLAARQETSLIDLILKFLGYTSGGILGLFLLGMLCRRSTGTGAFWGAILSTLFLLMISDPPALPYPGGAFKIPQIGARLGIGAIPFLWYTAVTLPLTMGIGWILSLFGRPPATEVVERWVWKNR